MIFFSEKYCLNLTCIIQTLTFPTMGKIYDYVLILFSFYISNLFRINWSLRAAMKLVLLGFEFFDVINSYKLS